MGVKRKSKCFKLDSSWESNPKSWLSCAYICIAARNTVVGCQSLILTCRVPVWSTSRSRAGFPSGRTLTLGQAGLSNIRHKDFHSFGLCSSRLCYPPWILKLGGLESSDQIPIPLNGKFKSIALIYNL